MNDDLKVNHNGELINFKDIQSGSIIINDDTGVFFIKEPNSLWRVISIREVTKEDNIKKINYVISKSNSTQINYYFMDLLSKEFPNNVQMMDDAEMYILLDFHSPSFHEGEGVAKDKYVSEKGHVIVDGTRYNEGDMVYHDNQKYIVRKSPNGEGYLELALSKKGSGYVIEGGKREKKEQVHFIDYTSTAGYFSPSNSNIYADYSNSNRKFKGKYNVLDYNGSIERRLKASDMSEVRYWECFDFSPGYKTKVSTVREKTISYNERKLTSKVTPTYSSSPVGYGEWLISLGGGYFSGGRKSKNRWVKLKNSGIFRWNEGANALYYRNTGSGFEEVTIYNFWRKGSNYNKAKKIGNRCGSFSNNCFFNGVKQLFGSKYRSYKWFVDAYKNSGYLKKPNNATVTTPHVNHGSGIKEKVFGGFKINSSSFDIQVRYNTFLRYKGNSDTMSRGKAKLQLIKYEGNSYTIEKEIFNINYNVGNYWDRSTDKWITKKCRGMDVGTYGFRLVLEDTYQDTKPIAVRVSPKVIPYSTKRTKIYDKSSFTFSVRDSATGKPVLIEGKKYIKFKGKEMRKCFRIVVPKGKEYIVKGKLVRGKAAEGGATGNGGSVRLDEGVMKYDVVFRNYPTAKSLGSDVSGLFPIPGWDIGLPSDDETEGEEGDVKDPFCWLDAIEIKEYFEPPITNEERKKLMDKVSCYPRGTLASLGFNDMDIMSPEGDAFLRANGDNTIMFFGDDIEFTLYNPLDTKVDMWIDFDVILNEECGGGGFINYFGGGFEYWNNGKFIAEGIEDVPSSVKIAVKEYISDHEIIGGDNGSYAEVLIKSEDNILKTIRVDENGWTDFNIDNLYDYGFKDYDIEIKTYQKGHVDPRGYDLRSTFILDNFDLFTSYELAATNFDSQLDFYINDKKKFSSDVTGEGEQYFPVKKGKNKYKFVFTTDHWDYNWDYAEIPWIRLTNWICDDIPVVPYCEPGGGDKCIEALIGCVLGLLPKKKGCVIIKHINHTTGEVMKQVRYGGYTKGDYTFHALSIPDFEVVGDSSKTVFIEESDICSEVEFYYRRLYRDCVYVLHKDITTDNIILKENYSNLVPGEYTFKARNFPKYKVVGETNKNLTIEYLTAPPEECKLVVFEYEPIEDKNPYLDCVWVIHREKDNPNNILATDHYYNLNPGKYKYISKDFEGYEAVGDKEKEVIIKEITEPVTKCKIVIFEYRKIKKGCVIVKFKDRVNNIILDTDYYYDLLPGEYTYNAKEFEGYKLVDDKVKTILVTEDDKECKEVIFLYEPLVEGCVVGKKIWLFT